MEKQRIKYYDVLRILSFLFVIAYHMLVQLHLSGDIVPSEVVSKYYSFENMNIATLAVALFFMLSGAGLTLGSQERFSLKRFYKSRFFRLLVPFYVVNLCFYAEKLIRTGYMPSAFYAGTPAWRYVFTVLGVDNWVGLHGISTFGLGFGEWFLGELVVLTALFPLMRACMNRWPKAFFALCTSLYVYFIYNYHFPVAMQVCLPLKGYEFVLGMYLGKYCKRFPDGWVLAAVPATVFFFTSKTYVSLNYALKITLSALCMFVAVSGLEPVLQKRKLTILAIAQQYSYPLFLVHHEVIRRMTPEFASRYSGRWSVLLFFLMEALVMLLFTVAVKFISDRLVGLMNRRPKPAQ